MRDFFWGDEGWPRGAEFKESELVLKTGITREDEEIPTQTAAGRPDFPGAELWPGWEAFRWE